MADTADTADTAEPIESAPARLIQERIEGLAWADEQHLAKGVDAQLAMVELLNQRGTTVVFFVMPGEPEVRASNYYQILGNVFEQAGFPSESDASSKHSLNLIDAGPVGTNDGIHLNGNSLQKIPEQLFKLVNGSLSGQARSSLPFDFRVSTSNDTGCSGGRNCSLTEAFQNDLLFETLSVWRPELDDYKLVRPATGVVRPLDGFWAASISGADGQNAELIMSEPAPGT